MNCLRTGKGSAVTNSSVLLIWSTRKETGLAVSLSLLLLLLLLLLLALIHTVLLTAPTPYLPLTLDTVVCDH
ncbi:hypothetical protein H671_7g17834 [Cricetulus griseus]|nr:hypothetical protein H671_7g17834 [Cricetulus griseus]